jgi:hypothetical protein
LTHYQARLIARFIQAMNAGTRQADDFRRQKSAASPDLGSGIHYLKSTRHQLEVEHYSYRRRLKKLISQMES